MITFDYVILPFKWINGIPSEVSVITNTAIYEESYLFQGSISIYEVLANEGWCYICNVFDYWLRPCSAIERTLTYILLMLLLYVFDSVDQQ